MGAYFPVFNVDAGTVWLDMLFSLFVGVLAAVVPACRSLRISIADGLRMVE